MILWKKTRQNDCCKRRCLTLRLLLVSRADTTLLCWPWMPPSAPTWCAEDVGTVAHQLLCGHCFQCQETTVTQAYFKCTSSVSLLLNIVPASESEPSHWLMSQGHHRVSLLAFWPLAGDLHRALGDERLPPFMVQKVVAQSWLRCWRPLVILTRGSIPCCSRIYWNSVKFLLCVQCPKLPQTGNNMAKQGLPYRHNLFCGVAPR